VADLNAIFKAYDVRGVFPEQLDEETAEKIGSALVKFLGCKTVVVGKDMRPSGKKLFKALVKGINSQGANVIDIGLCSTDLYYYSVWKLGAGAGAMITASHNSSEYNGLKIVKEKARPIGEETGLKEIKKLVEKNDFKESGNKGTVGEKNLLDDFVKECREFVEEKKIRSLKVVMDAGNGMASVIAPKMFDGLPIEAIEQCFELDGNFPNHDANPLKPENTVDTKERVKKEKADLGIMWDGDADRCFFVDDRGETVPSEWVAALLAEKILGKNKGRTVLYDVRCSRFLHETVEKNGGKPVMQRVGHAFFKENMRKLNAVFGAELSGHNYYKIGDLNFDSGFIPALQLMQILSENGKPLSELLQGARERFFHSGEINSDVKDKDAKISEIEEAYKEKAKKVYRMDGISVEFEDYWFNVRKSNTEPVLRLVLEAFSKQLMEEKTKEVLEIIRSK